MREALRAALVCCVLAWTACAPAPPTGVILVVVDTLRADHLGVYGYGRRTSPEIDRWAGRGVVFERAVATSPWTLPTFGSILTGKLLAAHRAGYRVDGQEDVFSGLAPGVVTLAAAAGRSGFATGAIVNNPFLSKEFGLARGFETYDYEFSTNWRHRRADVVVDRALEWIERHAGERFFLLMHLFDPHMTYDAPAPVRGRFTAHLPGGFSLPVEDLPGLRGRAPHISDEERAFVEAAYDEEIFFADRELGRFFATLEDRGVWDRTLTVLTADHGEELFDHGGFEHGHTMYQELLHVPLVIWAPGLRGRRVKAAVSVADLAPTILSAMGIETPEGLFGQTLWPGLLTGRPLPVRPLVAEGTLSGPERKTVLDWPFKLVVEPGGGDPLLFDLEKDPGEKENRAADEPERVLRLQHGLDGIIEAQEETGLSTGVPMSPETLEKLRSLGYVK